MKRLTSKRNAILILLGGSAISLIGWSQNWAALTLSSPEVKVAQLLLTGQTASSLPAGLALVSFATSLVALTAGKPLAYVIATLNAAAGFGILAISIAFVMNPNAFAYKSLSDLSGLSDHAALQHLVSASHIDFGLWLTLCGGVLIIAGAVAMLAGVHTWTKRPSRYTTSTPQQLSTKKSERIETVVAWDEMSQGTDPTT